VSFLTKPFSWLTAGLRWRTQAFSQKMRHAKEGVEARFRSTTGLTEPEEKLITDSQSFWNDQASRNYGQDSHWRGGGIFSDESKWLELGKEHVRYFESCTRLVSVRQPMTRVVEWGCGGGMNAIHFAPLAAQFCGIDISHASLEECAKQMKLAGLDNFLPMLIDAAHPEAALALVPGPSDLFLCTFVFEVLPSPEYGYRLLRIAKDLLAPGGLAIVQVKYTDGWQTHSRRWNYAKNLAWHATYRIEEFWQKTEECGFIPKMVSLVPKQTLINDRNYAYFLLQKPTGEHTNAQPQP
jgi:SAM-dependent methyltransferase